MADRIAEWFDRVGDRFPERLTPLEVVQFCGLPKPLSEEATSKILRDYEKKHGWTEANRG